MSDTQTTTMNTVLPRVGFIGAGKMATALARGICLAGLTVAEDLLAADVLVGARRDFEKVTGAKAVESNIAVANASKILVISVKPQHVKHVLHELRGHITAEHLVISIAAGVTLKTLDEALRDRHRLVRVMPNTPCLIGESASAFCIGGTATADDAKLVELMLSSVGIAFQLPEITLDAVTGLSGSGPAYAYLMIEALSDGGVRMGLPRDIATRLAAQTLLGAAKMVLETREHPGALKDAVASPGGTTIAGLHALEVGGLRGTLMNAVQAATLRSRELSQS